MNSPAPKEPSMDEILSSIRQIIADDDAAVPPRRPGASPNPFAAGQVPAGMPAPRSAPVPMPTFPSLSEVSPEADDGEPLALSPDQILGDDSGQDEPVSFDFPDVEQAAPEPQLGDFGASASLVDPDDIGFEPDMPEALAPPPAPMRQPMAYSESRAVPRPSASVAHAAPMPDPHLSRDLAEQLIEPATNSAVRQTFSKLNGIGLGNHGVTLEAMMKDMLRPMLKEWLDENLPALVERMVEKEIARISRGVD